VSALEPLLTLQERDLALDRIRHRLTEIPERARVEATEARIAELRATRDALRTQRDAVAREEQRHEDEASSLGEHAATAEAKLYSGEISSPRELQALQADIQQLKRHQKQVEDRQLASMEQREPLDAQLVALDADATALDGELATQREALAEAESTLGAELETESFARDEVAPGIDGDLLEVYEQCREKANGVGAARLVGTTCQGCHLSIPATEVARVKKAPAGTVEHCDNCGTILVP
jgi:predicted  nucleic acid-binding Zn-ribbon protein